MNNNLNLWLIENWDGSSWVNSLQFILELDTNGNLTLGLLQDWDGSSWVHFLQVIQEFDANNNQTLSLQQEWDGGGWVNESRELYYYQLVSSASELGASAFHFQVFPNPSKGDFAVDLGNDEIVNGSVRIYNSIGQLVYAQTMQSQSNELPIQALGLPEGTYFLQILDGRKQTSQKIVIVY